MPGSSFHEGRFGRMFRLEPHEPTDRELGELAERLIGGEAETSQNPDIPSGYTYLGQFLDHDITFDPVSSLTRRNDPDALHDFRTPRFDLDSVYGSGPHDQPYLYDQRPGRHGRFALDEHDGLVDLPRVHDRQAVRDGRDAADPERAEPLRTALVGDPRNDENLLVSQLHLTMLHFHNKVLDDLEAGMHEEALLDPSPEARFDEAARIVRWHYQWLVLHDYLPRTCGAQTMGSILTRSQRGLAVESRAYRPHDGNAFMPVEFSGAAYRFGHSQVRSKYQLNSVIGAGGPSPALDVFRPRPNSANQLEHLGGHRELPRFWQVEWRFFFDLDASAPPQPSRLIDTELVPDLAELPPDVATGMVSLAARNLFRGRALGLPSGQRIACAMGEEVLTPRDLDHPGRATPLWYYVLAEAEKVNGGRHLGPVGGRIVGEVMAGLVAHDRQSFLAQEPSWQPFLGTETGRFDMPDLLRYTGFGLDEVSFSSAAGVPAQTVTDLTATESRAVR